MGINRLRCSVSGLSTPSAKSFSWNESGHEPQLRAVHADGATAKSAKMGGEARPSGSGVGLMHRLRCSLVCHLEEFSESLLICEDIHFHK